MLLMRRRRSEKVEWTMSVRLPDPSQPVSREEEEAFLRKERRTMRKMMRGQNEIISQICTSLATKKRRVGKLMKTTKIMWFSNLERIALTNAETKIWSLNSERVAWPVPGCPKRWQKRVMFNRTCLRRTLPRLLPSRWRLVASIGMRGGRAVWPREL